MVLYFMAMAKNGRIQFCELEELKRVRRVTKWVDELRDELTALYLGDKQIVVMSSICLHNGGEFDVDWDKQQLRCRWHDWKFDIKTGECLSYSLPGRRLTHYPCEVQAGKVDVLLAQEKTA